MKKRGHISFTVKLLSNHYYLNEVRVEGKRNRRLYFHLGTYDLYAGQIIRTGNCLTLLSNPYEITVERFWNPNYFEDFVRYVFWTFNEGFRGKLIRHLDGLMPELWQIFRARLEEHFVPFGPSCMKDADQELRWCLRKNEHLKKARAFDRIYQLDLQNRTAIMKALTERLSAFEQAGKKGMGGKSTKIPPDLPDFPDMLRPMNRDKSLTLNFIREKSLEADPQYNLFRPVRKLGNGKNPYGLNGRMAAMLDFFYQLDYFREEYTLPEIFKAYLRFSGNSIGKLSTFLSEFRADKAFLRFSEKLKSLGIEKLP